MAFASVASSTSVSDITQCSICLETYKEPKALPCIHTFCLQCLEQHCNGKGPKVKCPLCRTFFNIPLGGNKNLPNNFFILQLLQVRQSTGGTENDIPSPTKRMKLSVNNCDQHVAEQNTLYCYDCKTVTCSECLASKHKRHCLTHVNESAEVFKQCLKEDVVNVSAWGLKKLENIKQLDINTNCFKEKVTRMQSEISQMYDQLIYLIQSDRNQLMIELDAFKETRLKEAGADKDEMERQFVITESFKTYVLEILNKGTACDISRTAHDLHARAEELVKTQDEPDCNKLNGVEITFTPSLSTTDRVKNFIGELVLTGAAQADCLNRHDVLAHHGPICSDRSRGTSDIDCQLRQSDHHSQAESTCSTKRLGSVTHSDRADDGQSSSSGTVFFCSTGGQRQICPIASTRQTSAGVDGGGGDQVLQGPSGLVGQVGVPGGTDMTRSGEDCRGVDLTKFLGRISVLKVDAITGYPVTGLTVLGSEVYALRRTPQVDVYKSDDFTLVRNLAITGSQNLRGLVSCSHYNCLYANDGSQKRIYRYDLTNDVITHWQWPVSVKYVKISVSKCYNVLVTLYDIKQIQEYTTNGQLVREINLNNSMEHPHDCVQQSNGYYAVSHVASKFHSLHRVCIVDQGGNIIHSYGGLPGTDVGQLNSPYHLAVDAHDNVLVADCDNNRVQLLSPTLNYLGDIVIPGYRFKGPHSLHVDALNHRLYIGELYGKRVSVLSVDT